MCSRVEYDTHHHRAPSKGAREAGINLETVRYYERQGLLPKPPRSASGYRLFPAEAARRIRCIEVISIDMKIVVNTGR
ncbi:MAG: hypothetical protein DMG76_33345 [Acidobacteria bacterium]|nr:MAG: hypothetical protein DMG76_33345 [Acidobacteriota bacterium]